MTLLRRELATFGLAWIVAISVLAALGMVLFGDPASSTSSPRPTGSLIAPATSQPRSTP